MRFAARETAIFSQFESGFGLVPGGGGMQHLVRLMGRGRALEVLLTADDYGADLAERYGWINRALPGAELPGFVAALAQRIAAFPASGQSAIKERINAVALAPVEDFRFDSDLFGTMAQDVDIQGRTKTALQRGFQTRAPEMELGKLIGELASRQE
jgi:enoyl-CoA hydratase/carnithine racemase